MKLGVSHQSPEMLTPQRLRYLKQMGVESLEVRLKLDQYTFDELVRIKRTVEEAGMDLFEVMLADRYNSPEICLGLPGREEAIKTFVAFIRDLGKLNIPHTTYAWKTGGAYATGRTVARESDTRMFELDKAMAEPNPYPKPYTEAEMWQSYKHFIREVLPVAEEEGVRLQLHPNDPPVDHQDIARIFKSTEAFRRAMEISSHNPYSSILFCVGTWAEMTGPSGNGEDIPGAIQEFGSLGHISQVHFRNVSSTLPDFSEKYPDDGYIDLFRIMEALYDVNFQGIVVPDHVPRCGESQEQRQLGESYCFGYIKALMKAVESSRGLERG